MTTYRLASFRCKLIKIGTASNAVAALLGPEGGGLLELMGWPAALDEGARQVKGYEAREIIGSHVSRFYTPEDLKRGWPQHELHVATREGRFEDEGWRLRKDGSRFWANVVITALRDRGGALIGFSKITRDLTERRRHEQALAESEERFRLLVEGVRDYAIVMLDTRGFVSSWNTGAERITGYRQAEVIGRHFSHFYTSEAIAANEPWRHLIAGSEPGGIADEGWRTRRDGTHFWAGSVLTTLHDGEGRHRGFVLVIQDLTQRRHAESLADTTARMHEFIAMLAHELRNPLAPIRNAIELMGRRGLGDPALESMRQMIERQAGHLTRIVDDLLDVNRIAHGRLSIGKERIDVTDVLNRAIETSRPLIDSRGHRLAVDVPAYPLELEGDAVRLTQVMINLLNNAAKYTPRGGEISLKAAQRDADIEIRVGDTGRGIAHEDLEKVFDLFAQLNPDSNGAEGGIGVGLALVRRVVELHGGTVRAASEGLGKGSEFIVRLPLPMQGRPQLLLLSGGGASAEKAPGIPRLRVLIVDDNRDAADSFHFLLEEMGQDVYTVYDGPTALEAADRLRPHVVMLDIGMPRMSGYEVAAALKSRLGVNAPVIVAVTGWGQDADKKQAEDFGIDYHFAKPVDQHALRKLLANIAADRGLGR